MNQTNIIFIITIITLFSYLSQFVFGDDVFTWNWKITDKVLSYKVDSKDTMFKKMVDSSFLEWEEKLGTIVFEKIKYGNADITFKEVKNLGSTKTYDEDEEQEIGGNTILYGNRDFNLIRSINIEIKKDLDDPLEKYSIIRHEIGHALGLKHSDNDNSIMNHSTDNYENQEITICDAYLVNVIQFEYKSENEIEYLCAE